MNDVVTMPAVPRNEQEVIDQFATKLKSQLTSKRLLLGGSVILMLALVLPIAILAVKAGFALAAVGGLVVLGLFAKRSVPLWLLKHENRVRQSIMEEQNRALSALKAEARKNPVEQLQNYLQLKGRQLTSYMNFVSGVGSEVKSAKDMLDERKKAKPDRDYNKKDEAIVAMQAAYQFHLNKVEAGKKALADLKEAVDDAKFDWQFGKVGQSAMQQMRALEGQDLLEQMLADESFDAVRKNFNTVFSDIEVQIGQINTAKQLEFGEGMTIDVSSFHIPTMKEIEHVES